jgi:APA family basic amino acid/polyamine antiporter
VIGLLGCLVLGFSLPGTSVVVGSGVIVVGAAIYAVRLLRRRSTADH